MLTKQERSLYSKFSIFNRSMLIQREWYYCYGCVQKLKVSEIKQWCDNEQTAICACWIDAALSEFVFDKASSEEERMNILQELHDALFGVSLKNEKEIT